MSFQYLQSTSRVVLVGLLIAIIAFIDWQVEVNIAFGFLYIFPLLICGTGLVPLANLANSFSLHISRRLF